MHDKKRIIDKGERDRERKREKERERDEGLERKMETET
jgi:hypothetical protein